MKTVSEIGQTDGYALGLQYYQDGFANPLEP